MEYSISLIALFSVSLACKNCFNEDCDTSGVCNQGCVAGFFGRQCFDKCPTNCIDSICQLDEFGRGVCIIGCSSGFYGVTCRAPCLSTNTDNKCDRHTGKPPVCDGSKHGSHCELSCNCSGKACDNRGTCLESCGIGLFGVQCDQECPSNCPMCKQQSGDCIVCKDGFYGDECQHKCVSAISPTQRSKYKSVPGCSITDNSVELFIYLSKLSSQVETTYLLMVYRISAIVSFVCFLTVVLIWKCKSKCCQRKAENVSVEVNETLITKLPNFEKDKDESLMVQSKKASTLSLDAIQPKDAG